VVINELGRNLFIRSEQQHGKQAECDRFLGRAAEQFEKTLAIEPEDMDAHFGLGQCYMRLGQSAGEQRDPKKQKSSGDLAELVKLMAGTNQPKETRVQSALTFANAVMAYGEKPPDPEQPKLLVLQKLIDQCLPIYRQEKDPEVAAAIALALGQLHFQAHAIIKPDDNAADQTIAMYRQKHPAAAKASQPIVIYPLHRPDAPGLKAANKGASPPKLSKGGLSNTDS